MQSLERIRRQRILNEIEGYLELLMLFDDTLAATVENRHRIAQRALDSLGRLSEGTRAGAIAQHLRGQALRALDRFADAVIPLRAAADLEPENLHIWLALGWCYKRCGRLDMAIESLQEAITAKPATAIVHYNLACYWSLAHGVDAALSHLAIAFELDPDYKELVHKEHDFDPIRDNPDFRQLTALLV
jgi:tetratricopeptide (TPR) repeat protein